MDYKFRKASIADSRQISYVHVDSWKQTYSGIIDSNTLSGLSYGKSRENWKFCFEKTSRIVYVAEFNKQVIGFAAGGVCRDEELLYDAEIYAMYILAEHQKKGIGKKFLQILTKEFIDEKWNSCLIWCLKNNIACGFYQKMGGIHRKTKKIKIGGRNFIEYGFSFDLENLKGTF